MLRDKKKTTYGKGPGCYFGIQRGAKAICENRLLALLRAAGFVWVVGLYYIPSAVRTRYYSFIAHGAKGILQRGGIRPARNTDVRNILHNNMQPRSNRVMSSKRPCTRNKAAARHFGRPKNYNIITYSLCVPA